MRSKCQRVSNLLSCLRAPLWLSMTGAQGKCACGRTQVMCADIILPRQWAERGEAALVMLAS